jgi:hypothetical protein
VLSRFDRGGAPLKVGLLALMVCTLMVVLLPARSLAGTPGPEWSLQNFPQSPHPRDHAEMAYDAATGNVVLTGGEGFAGNETWTYDGTAWTEQSTPQSPPQLFGSGVAYDAADKQIVIADGVENGGGRSLTWTYDGSTWSEQHPAQSTPALDFPAMAYDPATEQVVLFSGQEELSESSETWLWNGTTWTRQTTPQSPPERIAASMAYDAASKQLILFGGVSNGSYLNDTWAYDGTTWTELHPAHSPPAGLEGAMAYDPATRQIVYFGGPGNGGNQTWTFDGGEWTQQSTPSGLYPRYGTSMTYDPATRDVVLFGGSGEVEPRRSRPNNETWLYGPGPKATPILSQTVSAGVPLGGEVHDDATLAGAESPTGKVDFKLFGPSDAECKAAPVFSSEVAASEAGSYESAVFQPAEAGTYRWVATYSGDANNEAVSTVCDEAGGSVTVAQPETKTGATTGSTGQSPPPLPTAWALPGISKQPVADLTIYTRAPKGLINSRRFHVLAGCGGVACALSASARVILPGLGTTVTLHGAATLSANQVHAVSFAMPKRVRALLRGYLRHHRGEHMKLDVTVTMTAGSTRQSASALLGVWTLPGLR